MSEKAVSIGNYVIGTGIDTFLGVDPYVSGSDQMAQILTEGTRKWVDAAFTVETDIDKLVDLMIEKNRRKENCSWYLIKIPGSEYLTKVDDIK